MDKEARKSHWDQIYSVKKLEEVSWYQPVPETSLQIIEDLALENSAKILDVGGGDSFLVDNMIRRGFDISVLDVSARAVERAKSRLGSLADKADFIVSDITQFTPTRLYDLWHDRAVLHFLTEDHEVEKYVSTVNMSIAPGGYAAIGVFSVDGPVKCSGIEVRRYDEEGMKTLLGQGFEVLEIFRTDHITPSDKNQNFIFGIFRRLG